MPKWSLAWMEAPADDWDTWCKKRCFMAGLGTKTKYEEGAKVGNGSWSKTKTEWT